MDLRRCCDLDVLTCVDACAALMTTDL